MMSVNNNFIGQAGRSMLEMLGVLAIVGVLSVGALSGYSSAMEKYYANQAIDEIENYIVGIKDLYSDKTNYDGISEIVLSSAGIFPEDRRNVYGEHLYAGAYVVNSVDVFRLDYLVPNDSVCKKILSSGLENDLGYDLIRIYVRRDGPSIEYVFMEWDPPVNAAYYKFPIKIDEINEICDNSMSITYNVR
ncbi:MAG: hypothetical protein GY804_03240 [Alphaproteobacteria bacterium]|nr:hypothetical protein [Alphaproteobacteria bacterium]